MATSIMLPEGYVRECSACGLAFSSCTKQEFYMSLEDHWSTSSHIDPPLSSIKRLRQRRSKELKVAKKLIGSKQQLKLLDIGCRTGTMVSLFDSFGLDARGIDPAAQPVEMGRSAGRKLDIGFVEQQGYASNSFDIVTMYEVIEHLPNPDVVLSEISRILRPGGILIVGTGNYASWTRMLRKSNWDFFSLRGRGGHIYFYSPDSLKKIGLKHNLHLSETISYTVKFLEKHDAHWSIYRLAKLFSELLSFPSQVFKRGHQMECFLVKR